MWKTLSVAGGDTGSPSPPGPEIHLHGDTCVINMVNMERNVRVQVIQTLKMFVLNDETI